jgi:exopolyphosphatase/guanosine-5'-triphosphate,3'-diphosphate pyrophosphatase
VAAIRALCDGPVDMLVGTGGNIETLAELCPTSNAVSSERFIAVPRIDELFAALCSLSAVDRAAHYGLRPDRADTILPAISILSRLAHALGQDRIAAPGVGLKEGVLIELARRHFEREDWTQVAAGA